MYNGRKTTDLYDVSTYSEKELYAILDLDNPSDRVLEAKILSMVNKYSHMHGNDAELLTNFFINIYTHFFDTEPDVSDTDSDVSDTSDTVEGFVGGTSTPDKGYSISGLNSNYTTDVISGEAYDRKTYNFGNNAVYSNFKGNTELLDETGRVNSKYTTPQITQTFDVNKITNRGVLDINKNDRDKDPQSGNKTQLTKQLDYSKDTLNPLLKQTIKRVISIDSQYRENKNTSSTEFTFNLSEPLKDVVSLKLYSIQIPYTWYTINGSFGGNFFYIKGDSPGINNGNHDYKIEIPSGNYTAITLQAKIQENIKILKQNMDVSFGTTDISYDGATVRSTLIIDMKETFGESNYYIEFPEVNAVDEYRNTTISGFLGYNNTQYDGCSVFSNYIPTSSLYTNDVSLVRGNIQFVNYTVNDPILYNYSNRFEYTEYGNIIIPFSQTINSNISTFVSSIHSSLIQHPDVDTSHSFVRIVDSNLNDGNSRIQMNVKFKRSFIQNIENIKTVAIFPETIVGNMFFPEPIIELSNRKSENPILKSRFIIESGKNIIQLKCIKPDYYTEQTNGFDYNIIVPQSSVVGFKLGEYIDAINNTINTQPKLNGTRIITTDTSIVRQMNVQINNQLNHSDYTLTINGTSLCKIFGYISTSSITIDLQDKHAFNSGNVFTVGETVIITKDDNLIIRSKYNPSIFYNIDLNTSENSEVYASSFELSNMLYTVLTGFTIVGEEPYNKNPFSEPIINNSGNFNNFAVTINIRFFLTTINYELRFISSQTPNTWSENLYFDPSYNLSSTAGTIEPSVKIITNNNPVFDNQFILDSTNNYFNIKSFSDADGLTKNGVGLYNVRVDIIPLNVTENHKYTVDEIYEAINSAFSENILSHGSSIISTGANYSGNTVIRLNINKKFSTKDYRLVFYDPYSFVSCYSGASRNGNKSVQNATWDTTIGWILGFRESIIYYLNEYIYSNDTTVPIRYTNIGETYCSLTGDTTVSTSLYNYFLIVLDDYTQNHLNDGLVTITTQETSIDVGPYTYVCDPYSTSGSNMIAVPIRQGVSIQNGKITGISQNELYTFNQKIQSKKVKEKSYSKGPFVKDIFGIIPIKTSGLTTGSTYVEFGGTLQNQERMYFGPVNIHRMTIRLLNDRGDLVDLNNSNWSFSLVCEQLYRNTI